MKIVVNVGYNTYFAFPVEQAGTLIPALTAAAKFTSEGYGDKKRYKAASADEPLEFAVVSDDKFVDAPEAFTHVQEARDAAEKRWLEALHKHQETKKALADATARLAQMKGALGEEVVA